MFRVSGAPQHLFLLACLLCSNSRTIPPTKTEHLLSKQAKRYKKWVKFNKCYYLYYLGLFLNYRIPINAGSLMYFYLLSCHICWQTVSISSEFTAIIFDNIFPLNCTKTLAGELNLP
jgi:hypothetical protein